ncbi:mRNA triphosphatase CET1 [Atractiella rhizophila]|nr:mRNA triphosphatase CET1 [Atractiella rhizophila]
MDSPPAAPPTQAHRDHGPSPSPPSSAGHSGSSARHSFSAVLNPMSDAPNGTATSSSSSAQLPYRPAGGPPHSNGYHEEPAPKRQKRNRHSGDGDESPPYPRGPPSGYDRDRQFVPPPYPEAEMGVRRRPSVPVMHDANPSPPGPYVPSHSPRPAGGGSYPPGAPPMLGPPYYPHHMPYTAAPPPPPASGSSSSHQSHHGTPMRGVAPQPLPPSHPHAFPPSAHIPPPALPPASLRRPPPQQDMVLQDSFFAESPLDEVVKHLADWIWEAVRKYATGKHPNAPKQEVEIEAKIGRILDNKTGTRLMLPVVTETILAPGMPGIRFESIIPPVQHSHFNDLLNQRIEKVASEMKGTLRGSVYDYVQTRTIDEFFPSGQRGVKTRVSRDYTTNAIIENGVMQKTKLGDLNVYCPKYEYDWRISVNLETQVKDVPTGQPSYRRIKDRVSYTHQIHRIDLTQVQSSDPAANPTHELELEMISMREFLLEGRKHEAGVSSSYLAMVAIFLNNIRILLRSSKDFPYPSR